MYYVIAIKAEPIRLNSPRPGNNFLIILFFSFFFFKHRIVSISCIRPDGELIRYEMASFRPRNERVRQNVSIRTFVYYLFRFSAILFPFFFHRRELGLYRGQRGRRGLPRWEIPRRILLRDRVAGIIKRYVTKLMERMKKPCREYRPGKDTSSTSIVPRMLERVHSTFQLPIAYREKWKQFSTIFNDLFRRDAAWT